MPFPYFLHHSEGQCRRAGNWLQADTTTTFCYRVFLAAGTSLNKRKQMQGKKKHNMTVKRLSLKMKQSLIFLQSFLWFDLISKLLILLNVRLRNTAVQSHQATAISLITLYSVLLYLKTNHSKMTFKKQSLIPNRRLCWIANAVIDLVQYGCSRSQLQML